MYFCINIFTKHEGCLAIAFFGVFFLLLMLVSSMFFEGINKGSTRSLNTDTFGFLTHKFQQLLNFFMNYNTNVVAHLPPIIFECSLCSQDVDNCYICYLS